MEGKLLAHASMFCPCIHHWPHTQAATNTLPADAHTLLLTHAPACVCEQETWGTSASPQKEAVCVQPARPADPVAHQFVHDEVIEDDGQDVLMAMLMDQRPRSAPNTPLASLTKGQEVLARAKSSDNAHDKQGAEDFEAIDSPSKFPVFAATPGKRRVSARAHVL